MKIYKIYYTGGSYIIPQRRKNQELIQYFNPMKLDKLQPLFLSKKNLDDLQLLTRYPKEMKDSVENLFQKYDPAHLKYLENENGLIIWDKNYGTWEDIKDANGHKFTLPNNLSFKNVLIRLKVINPEKILISESYKTPFTYSVEKSEINGDVPFTINKIGNEIILSSSNNNDSSTYQWQKYDIEWQTYGLPDNQMFPFQRKTKEKKEEEEEKTTISLYEIFDFSYYFVVKCFKQNKKNFFELNLDDLYFLIKFRDDLKKFFESFYNINYNNLSIQIRIFFNSPVFNFRVISRWSEQHFVNDRFQFIDIDCIIEMLQNIKEIKPNLISDIVTYPFKYIGLHIYIIPNRLNATYQGNLFDTMLGGSESITMSEITLKDSKIKRIKSKEKWFISINDMNELISKLYDYEFDQNSIIICRQYNRSKIFKGDFLTFDNSSPTSITPYIQDRDKDLTQEIIKGKYYEQLVDYRQISDKKERTKTLYLTLAQQKFETKEIDPKKRLQMIITIEVNHDNRKSFLGILEFTIDGVTTELFHGSKQNLKFKISYEIIDNPNVMKYKIVDSVKFYNTYRAKITYWKEWICWNKLELSFKRGKEFIKLFWELINTNEDFKKYLHKFKQYELFFNQKKLLFSKENEQELQNENTNYNIDNHFNMIVNLVINCVFDTIDQSHPINIDGIEYKYIYFPSQKYNQKFSEDGLLDISKYIIYKKLLYKVDDDKKQEIIMKANKILSSLKEKIGNKGIHYSIWISTNKTDFNEEQPIDKWFKACIFDLDRDDVDYLIKCINQIKSNMKELYHIDDHQIKIYAQIPIIFNNENKTVSSWIHFQMLIYLSDNPDYHDTSGSNYVYEFSNLSGIAKNDDQASRILINVDSIIYSIMNFGKFIGPIIYSGSEIQVRSYGSKINYF